MLILKSENKVEFRSILDQLKASNISVVRTRTPGYFTSGEENSTPRFFLFVVVIVGVCLGILLISYINSVWGHQISNKPQNLSGIIGWFPVVFEVTILFAAIIYLSRFIKGISKRDETHDIEIIANHYYCFLKEKNETEKEYILSKFKQIEIIEC